MSKSMALFTMKYTSGAAMVLFGGTFGSFRDIYGLLKIRPIAVSRPYFFEREIDLCFFDRIPIIRNMILNGKCGPFGSKLTLNYPIVESLIAILFVLFYKKYGLSFELLVNMVLASLLVIISLIDLDARTIPDVLSIGGIVAGLCAVPFRSPIFFFRDAFYGILFGGLLYALASLYRLFAKKEAVGTGDMKLLTMIGSFCGLKGVLFSLLAGSILGSVVGFPLMVMKGKSMQYAIPFGPSLSLGALIFLFQGDRFVYLFVNIVSGR